MGVERDTTRGEADDRAGTHDKPVTPDGDGWRMEGVTSVPTPEDYGNTKVIFYWFWVRETKD